MLIIIIDRYGIRPIPNTSQNKLSQIKLLLEEDKDPTGMKHIGMTLLYDTGAALNIGYLLYHALIQQRNPRIIALYDTFDGSNQFDFIKLYSAITDPSEYDVSKHGMLITIIEYYTPCLYSNGKPFKLTLALRGYISMNSILGLSTIIEDQIEPRW